MEAEKGKRQLTAEQLENLKKGREKARLVKIQLKEINETRRTEERERKKEAISNEKREKDAKREEAYKAVIELKNAKQERNSKKEVNSDEEIEKPAPKPISQPKSATRAQAKPPPPPQDEPSEEEEEEEIEEVYEPPPRKTVVKPPLPPPSQLKRKPRPQRREPTDAELYQNANIEMLRKRFMEQTRNRLVNDLFNY